MIMPITERERKLTRLLVQCAMMVHDPNKYFEGKSYDEVGDWIREQLKENGFESVPKGMNHVYLTKYTKND